MAIVNQRACHVDGVPVALGDFCYSINPDTAGTRYFCSEHWPVQGVAAQETILESSSIISYITRYPVFDDSVM